MRIVVKVGTNVLRAGTPLIHRPRLIELARQLAELLHGGHEPVLVSSGAIWAGREILSEGVRVLLQKQDVRYKQMLAALGQGRLLALYQQIFALYNVTVAQALLTQADLANRTGYLNARNTFQLLLYHNMLPIVNENDVVGVDEIKFGDNDRLSAMVANLIDADLLVILTDQRGLFTADPRQNPNAELIAEVPKIDEAIRAMAGGSGKVGTGGMVTKIQAAEFATNSGTEVVIAPGNDPDSILRVVAGEELGTRFLTQVSKIESRKRWLLAEPVKGTVSVDAGAARALLQGGKSLLVVGVTAVSGAFERGTVVNVLDPAGVIIARGMANYSFRSLPQVMGHRSNEIADILGYDYGPTAIHRDNLVLTRREG